MDAPDRIGIVGTGLIGAALAALVTRRAPGVAIEAVEPQGAYRQAVAAQLPRVTWRNCAGDLGECDMVFLCCPPNAVQSLAREVLEAGEGLVIDAGSVKARIVEGLSDAPRFFPAAEGAESEPHADGCEYACTELGGWYRYTSDFPRNLGKP